MSAADAVVASLLDEVRRTDWQAWAIPLPGRIFVYRAERVVPAFEFAVNASESQQGVYTEMLDAIAHNHSGTPYAAMAPATQLLARLVPHLGAGAAPAMEVLSDAVCWSAGEPTFTGPDGLEHSLGRETLAAARTLESLAQHWTRDRDVHRSRAAAGLLDVLNDFRNQAAPAIS